MISKDIILSFSNKEYVIKGSMTLGEFKNYMDSMSQEEAIEVGKAMRRDINSYLNLVPKRERKILEKPVKPIDPIIDIEQINWKQEALKWKQESLKWKLEAQKWEEKHNKLQQEFNEFKVEVKLLIIELKTEINQLNQKVSYYDKKYNNEYDRVKKDLNGRER